MTERKAISKKIRFEVFKRDRFTCQYCGRSAPDIILNIDHILPVSKGGENDITNLITSCFDCNSGKKDRLLSDSETIKRQKAQLDELQERRDQLKMMMQWNRELLNIEKEYLNEANIFWGELVSPYYLTEHGEKELQKLIDKFGLSEVLECMRISTSQYLECDDNNKFTQESVNKSFEYISKIATFRKLSLNKPYIRDLYYIRGILRKRMNYVNNWQSIQILEKAYKNGIDIDRLKSIAIESPSYSRWRDYMEYEIEIAEDQCQNEA